MDSDDDILHSFIEDTREHLAGIEESLLDMEQAGAAADPEMVNTVFRAAHSIKGGAGFLGLDKVRDLAHRLENVLHMMRSGEMDPGPDTVSPLLAGFDLLRSLVESGKGGNGRDIAPTLEELTALAARHLHGSDKGLMDSAVDVPAPRGGPSFTMDMLTLRQSLQGGKHLYLVEYDLIHDVHARGKTPLDVLSVMESSGLILDSRVDLEAVGDLDAPPTNRIPFYLLFATIVEPDVAGYLFALDSSRIQVIDPESLHASASGQPDAGPSVQAAGPGAGPGAVPEEGTCVLEVSGDLGPDALEGLRARALEALDAGSSVVLDLGRAGLPGAAFVQFACAARRSFTARGLTFSLAGQSEDAGRRLERLGFGQDPAAALAGEAA